MTTWFTADLHVGHHNILPYARRPFSDLDQMHQAIIERWNERVESTDIVWILGDLVMGQIYETLPLCKQLTGTKVLLCGNHDRPWAGNTRRSSADQLVDWAQRYKTDGGINVVLPGRLWNGMGIRHYLRDRWVYLSHFPYTGDSHDEDRYADWRPGDDGHSWLLHGHVHNAWQVDVGRRQVNVGVDVWDYAPVSADEIVALIDAHT